MAANYRMDSEEEALFRSYPYAVYFVQSPSTISHANSNTNNNNNNYDHLILYNQSPTRVALSRYSSSRGSNNSFMQDNNIKKIYSHDDHVHGELENGEKVAGIKKTDEVDDNDRTNDDEYEHDDDEQNKGYWTNYLSFSYSNSVWWILLQLSWRFLLSLIVASVVFYIAAKPPAPKVSVKIARIQQFRLGEGVDGSGVTTKILNCNCSIDLIIDNNSKLFPLHIYPPTMQILFGHLPIAVSQMEGGELYAGSDDLTLFKLNIGTRNKPMYGAGRNMQDLLESGKGLPLVIRVSLRSRFHVILGVFQSKFHHEVKCLVVLGVKYDKKNRTQVYNSTCIINP